MSWFIPVAATPLAGAAATAQESVDAVVAALGSIRGGPVKPFTLALDYQHRRIAFVPRQTKP